MTFPLLQGGRTEDLGRGDAGDPESRHSTETFGRGGTDPVRVRRRTPDPYTRVGPVFETT